MAYNPVNPFFSPEDLIAMNQWLGQVNDTRAEQESALANARTETNYQTSQTNRQAAITADDTADSLAGRGLFESSIKDASMFDIEAQRALQTGFLKDRLHQTELDHDAWVSKYGGTLTDGKVIAGTQQDAQAKGLPLGTSLAQWYQGWQAKAAENAKTVNDQSAAAYAAQQAAAQQAAAQQAEANRAALGGAAPPKGLYGQVPVGGSPAAAAYKNVVKNGKFYHVYNGGKAASDWRYIRPAGR